MTRLLFLDVLAERRIDEARARGEFDNLPGSGAPLELDDDALVPEELRVAHRILKNAGLLPPQLEPCREIRDIEALLLKTDDGSGRARLLARINFLVARGAAGRRHGDLRIEQAYAEKLSGQLERYRGVTITPSP